LYGSLQVPAPTRLRSIDHVQWLLGVVAVALIVLTSGCPGANGIGQDCDRPSDCDDGLQCIDHTCVPLCKRHVDCGDGFLCQENGTCVQVVSAINDPCEREVDCGPGQSCQLDSRDTDGDHILGARCGLDRPGAVPGSACTSDDECRNGACAIGRCVDLCLNTSDCPLTQICASLPRIELASEDAGFFACLPHTGQLTYQLPVERSSQRLRLPVPGHAISVTLIASVKEPTELIGATSIVSPSGETIYTLPADQEQFYANRLRHRPTPGFSVLMIPNTPALDLEAGAYDIDLASVRPNGSPGGVPTVTAIYKLDDAAVLDLHFYFMDLSDDACLAPPGFDAATLDATTAPTSNIFNGYLTALRLIFARAGILVGEVTYQNLFDENDPFNNRTDLYNLETKNLGALLKLSNQDGGVNVFFVRSIAPAGTQALSGGNPGMPGRAGTDGSGVAIAIDTLCYRDWSSMARITMHELAKHLGLFHNREPDGAADPIPDSDTSSTNLMFYSEFGSTDLSAGQKRILRQSPVLR
jgi:hypothetical protein